MEPASDVLQTVADGLETELQNVERWRRDELERAGYSDVIADLLASDHTVDLHDAIAMIRAGCSQNLAIRILL